MKIKAAFFDLDWTLYDHKNDRWDMASIEKIKELQKQGVKVFICTARPYSSFEWLGAFKLGLDWDGYIASAGGYAFADGEYLFKSHFEEKDVRRFIELALENKKSLELVEYKKRKLIAPLNEEGKEHFKIFKEMIPEIEPYEGEEVEGINFFANEKMDPLFQKEFPHLIYWRYTPNSVDVAPIQHEKGACISIFLKHYGFKKDEAIAFGDDLQDLTMAREVGTFICMANGKDEVKKVAKLITKEVWNSGVAYAIDQLLNGSIKIE